MDALTDILRSIRLQSAVYFEESFCAPWGMEMGDSGFGQFHMVIRGNCWLGVEGVGDVTPLSGGDVVLLPFGKPHWLADQLNSPKIPGGEVYQAHLEGKPILKGDGIPATLICGHYEFDRDSAHPFLKDLPEMILLRGTEVSGDLETVVKLISSEMNSKKPGSEALVHKLAEVLFVQIVRSYSMTRSSKVGFLNALQDEKINRALSLVHRTPESKWTLENLAHQIGMSRTSFANRFRELVGDTPIQYITDLRLQKSRELLTTTRLPISGVCERVGYGSEAAFIRAFKRSFNLSPGTYRRQSSP